MPNGTVTVSSPVRAKLDRKPGKIALIVFALLLIVGLGYAAMELVSDISKAGPTTAYPFVLLGLALLIALGFEFVNGFHDSANAVATVIYTHAMEPHVAVVWSGL